MMIKAGEFIEKKQEGATPIDVPEDFICPITQDFMWDPVITANGNTFDRIAIETWLATHNTDPLDNSQLSNKILIPNNRLKSMIHQWAEQNNFSKPDREKKSESSVNVTNQPLTSIINSSIQPNSTVTYSPNFFIPTCHKKISQDFIAPVADLDYSILYKIMMVGDSNSGKLSYARYCFGDAVVSRTKSFSRTVDFLVHTTVLNGERIKLKIWDTADQEISRTIPLSYYHNSSAIMIVCNLNSINTINRIFLWHKEILRNSDEKIQLRIVGTISEDAKGQYPEENLTVMRSIAYELGIISFVVDFSQIIQEEPMLDLIDQLEAKRLQTLQQKETFHRRRQCLVM